MAQGSTKVLRPLFPDELPEVLLLLLVLLVLPGLPLVGGASWWVLLLPPTRFSGIGVI